MRFSTLKAAGLCFGAIFALLMANAQDAQAQTFTVEATNSSGPGNCIPFGQGSIYGPFQGFIYKNIPAFALKPGDTIAFDLGNENDADIIMDIAMAQTTSNGSDVQNAAGFTTVVSSGTPSSPRGNNINGDYELAFTATDAFNFTGGGLIIRFRAQGSFANDNTCTGVVRYGNASDTSNFFVRRFYQDTDGIFPWTGTSTSIIGNFRISASGQTPTVQDQSQITNEDTDATFNLQGNDPQNLPLTYAITTPPTNGTITNINAATGQVTYRPNADYNGPDSFQYTATSALGTTQPATVTLTVRPVNDLPVANDDALTVDEDSSGTGTLTASDVDGDTLTFSLGMPPMNGSVLIAPNGDYTYTPNADFNGTDSFTFVVNDGTANSAPRTVNITVNSVNDAPMAVSATLTTDEDTSANNTLLASDVDGDPITFRVTTQPANGTLTLGNNGNYSYTPNANFNGTDSFTFVANDGTVDSVQATIDITVNAVNDAPVVQDGTLTTDEDVAGTGTVSATDVDGDALTYNASTPANGMVTVAANGDYTYTPNANFNGTDSFTVTVSDGTTSDTATITVTINAVNDAPVAIDATATTDEDNTQSGTVLGTDIDGDVLSYAVGTQPANGTVTMMADGNYTYTPNANFNGTDTFTFTATDGTLTSAPGTITITVNAVNDAPMAQDGTLTTDEDVAGTGTVSATDADGDALTYAVDTQPANGMVTVAADGSYTYTPNANFNGTDSFTVIANDGTLNSNTATITVTVNVVNDAPALQDTSYTTPEDTALTETVTATDADGDTISYRIDRIPTNGTITIDAATGAFTYTPNANFAGTDTFTVIANDGTVDSAAATITINVSNENDAPEFIDPTPAADANIDTPDGQEVTFTVAAQDADGDTITLSIDNPPANATFDANTGVFTWTPSWQNAGMVTLTLKASDGTTETTRDVTINITITDGDGDNVPDSLEDELGLDKTTADSDGDNISDLEELGDLLNPADTDNDQTIDALDTDSDGDMVNDIDEAGDDDLTTPAIDSDMDGTPNFRQMDSDMDTIADGEDNCPLVANTDQKDTNEDGIGDACQDDDDGDTIADDVDNCPTVANTDQLDTDNDMQGDACDGDDDDDTIADDVDNCPLVANTDQADLDKDGIGSACDDEETNPNSDKVTGGTDENCGCTSVDKPQRQKGKLWLLMLGVVGLLGLRRRK